MMRTTRTRTTTISRWIARSGSLAPFGGSPGAGWPGLARYALGDGAGSLEAKPAALLGEDEFDPERVIGQQLLANAFFLVAAGFAVGDDHGQSAQSGVTGESGKGFEFLIEQGRREMAEERFHGLLIGKRHLDKNGF